MTSVTVYFSFCPLQPAAAESVHIAFYYSHMHKLTHAFHKRLGSHSGSSVTIPSTDSQPKVTSLEQDLYRYRKQRGVNLGERDRLWDIRNSVQD